MTITTTAIKAVAQGNGANTNWPYTFLIPGASDLVVTLVTIASGNEAVVSPVNYSVTGIGNDAGGQVTYPLSGSPLSALFQLVIERVLPLTQETDLVNQGGAYPQDIEDALDYLTMTVQQLQDQINRAIVFSSADLVEVDLPVASARANLSLTFNSNGDPVATSQLTPGTTVSAAMIPVVTAPTTAAALAALGIPGTLLDLLIPSGTEWNYDAGGSAPTGFVFPIGQPCTPTYPDYRAKLIAAGSPYGTNGVDPLMPDRRGSVAAGKSNMGGVDNGLLPGGTVLGAVLGSSVPANLAANQIPSLTSVNAAQPITVFSTTTDIVRAPAGLATSNAAGGLNGQINGLTGTTGQITSNNNNSISVAYTNGAQQAVSRIQLTFVCNIILKVH